MHPLWRYFQDLSIIFGFLLLLSACSQPLSNKTAIPTHARSTPTAATTNADQSCPAPDSARAAFMPALKQGLRSELVYIANNGTASGGTSFSNLWSYDVLSESHTLIVDLQNAIITNAQVSNDGQWVLFVSETPINAQIQLVRLDGQDLQTLYCAPRQTILSPQWSPDHTTVIFSQEEVSGPCNLYLYSLATGKIKPELVHSPAEKSAIYEAYSWVDSTHVYVVGLFDTPEPDSLYLLDTAKGLYQQPDDLQEIFPPWQYCWDFDSDYNATTMITSQCTATFPKSNLASEVDQGPSTISVQSIAGKGRHIIYGSKTAVVREVRMLGYSSKTLLLTTQDGLWKMNTDGSNMVQLMVIGEGVEGNLNRFSRYPWANVSPDGKMFAFQVTNPQEQPTVESEISIDMLNDRSGGASAASVVTQSPADGMIAVVGWAKL